jgi:hypothetical protein
MVGTVLGPPPADWGTGGKMGHMRRALLVAPVVILAACGATPAPRAAPPATSAPCGGDAHTTVVMSDTTPTPSVAVAQGACVPVKVPASGAGTATDPTPNESGILREVSSQVLPDRGRVTVFQAVKPGRAALHATVTPPTDAMMPAWSLVVDVH